MVTKAVPDRAQVVNICPDPGQTEEAATWRPFVDGMTKAPVSIPDAPLYLPDGKTSPLPEPRWGSIASLIDGNDCDTSLDERNPQVVKFLHRVNRGLTRSDLLKRYGHDTPATTPKDVSEVQEIHPPTDQKRNRTLTLEILKLTRSTFSGERSVKILQMCNRRKSVKKVIWQISISLIT